MALKLVTPQTAPLVSLAEAKKQLNILHNDDDDYITALVATAEEHIGGVSGWTGRALVNSTWEYSLDSFPAYQLQLPKPPLISIEAIEYVDVDGVTQSLAGYRSFGVNDTNQCGYALPAYDGEWPGTRDNDPEAVRVTFKAGYATAPTPIKHAVLLMVSDWFENREDSSEIKLEQIPHSAEALLMPFRFWSV